MQSILNVTHLLSTTITIEYYAKGHKDSIIMKISVWIKKLYAIKTNLTIKLLKHNNKYC